MKVHLNAITVLVWEVLYVSATTQLLRNFDPVKESHEPTVNSEKRFLTSTALTHFHEELPLLHHGLASFTAFLDHSVAHETQQHETPQSHSDMKQDKSNLICCIEQNSTLICVTSDVYMVYTAIHFLLSIIRCYFALFTFNLSCKSRTTFMNKLGSFYKTV